MKSCPILPHEVGKLGTEGFSGEIPTKLSLNGSGQGLWRTKMLLEVNNSTLNIYPNYTNEGRMTYNGFEYESNCFEVVVPNEQIDFKR